jgi:hypothetical protein
MLLPNTATHFTDAVIALTELLGHDRVTVESISTKGFIAGRLNRLLKRTH